MKVVTQDGTFDLGTTEVTPTIGMTDFSRRETDDFGVTTVVRRGFSRRMSVKVKLPFADVDAVKRRLEDLRAKPALWIADDRFVWLSLYGHLKDFDFDLATPPLSGYTLTVDGLAEMGDVADSGADPALGRASTLQLLQPITVTDAVLAGSEVPENDAPEWAGGTAYGKGARVIRAATHRIYESLQAGNAGRTPESEPAWWLDLGPTNRWAMFDQALGTATSRNGGLEVTLNGGAANALSLIDIVGDVVRVRANGYDQSEPVRPGAITFVGLPGSGQVTVNVIGAQAAVGTLLIGRMVGLGVTEAAPTAGITDFSRKETDDFGTVTIVERGFSKRMTARALIRPDALDLVADRIAKVRARPSLWIGQSGVDAITIYGFVKDFDIEVGTSVNKLSLTVEGLTKAAPIATATGQIVPRGDYDPATIYAPGAVVQYQGSSWLYINPAAASGYAPPTLPTTENGFWRLYSRRWSDSANLMDTSGWVPGATGTIGRFEATNGPTGESSIYLMPYGPTGASEPVWAARSSDDVFDDSPGAPDGGWNFHLKADEFDHRKSYRLMVWVRQSGDRDRGGLFFGTGPQSITLAGTEDSNPYFWTGNLPEDHRWYLAVGILHGSGYTGPDTGQSGVYDPVTGARIASGGDWRQKPGATFLRHRVFQYYRRSGAAADFSRPSIEPMTDATYSVQQLFATVGMTASEAQAFARAQQRIADITSDGLLTAGTEKSIIKQQYDALVADANAAHANSEGLLSTYGVDPTYDQRANMDAALLALNSYLGGLTPRWDEITADTEIDGLQVRTLFGNAFSKVATLRQAVEAYISGRAKVALDKLAAIASDNVIATGGEKNQLIQLYQQVADLSARAHTASAGVIDTYGADPTYNERVARDSAMGALNTYLGRLGPANWNDVNGDTNVDGVELRRLFADAQATANALLAAVNAYVSNRTKGAIDRVTAIGSDNVLSAGSEKQTAVIDFNTLYQDLESLYGKYTALGSPADLTPYVERASANRQALASYLGNLGPPNWNQLNADTAIVSADWSTAWQNAYNHINALRAQIAGRKGDKGDTGPTIVVSASPQVIRFSADGVILSGPVTFRADLANLTGTVTWRSLAGHQIYDLPAHITFSGNTMTISADRMRDVLNHNESQTGSGTETIIAELNGVSHRVAVSKQLDGAKGLAGPGGYSHLAYANSADGTVDFHTSEAAGRRYLGSYTDQVEADSNDPARYTWTLTKGNTGDKGDKGDKGDQGDTVVGPKGDPVFGFVQEANPGPGQFDRQQWYQPDAKQMWYWLNGQWNKVGGLLAAQDLIASSAQLGTAVIVSANIKDLEVDTIKIRRGAVTDTNIFEAGDAFIYANGEYLLAETPSTFLGADGYSRVMALFSCVLEPNSSDAGATISIYADYGNGPVFQRAFNAGVRASGGGSNAYFRLPITLPFTISATGSVKFTVYGRSFNLGGGTTSSYVRSIRIDILRGAR